MNGKESGTTAAEIAVPVGGKDSVVKTEAEGIVTPEAFIKLLDTSLRDSPFTEFPIALMV